MASQREFVSFLQENQIILPSASHYGGISGFKDYGINGIKLKNKILDQWRNLLANEDNLIYEIETPTLLPNIVLKASGHVDNFDDMVVELENGDIKRADHLVGEWLVNNKQLSLNIDSMNMSDLEKIINDYNICGQKTYVKVTRKNLMFKSNIHDTENVNDNNTLYLRPEIAQGIFLSIKQIQIFLKKDVGFGISQTGKSYRKEINPSETRFREFTQAEVEYLYDPYNKTHINYDTIKYITIPILTANNQNINQPLEYIRINTAINNKLISSELMGFFMANIHKLAINIGIDPEKIRFRQQLDNEKAHYSLDCWDLECYVDNKWLECVGISDRGDYDLKSHSKFSSNKLLAKRFHKDPISEIVLEPILNYKNLSKHKNINIENLKNYFSNQTQESLLLLKQILESNNNVEYDDIMIDNSLIAINEKVITHTYENYYPHIIEPSLGIDRLLYTTLKHNFRFRNNDNKKIVLSLSENMILYNVAIFPLLNKQELWDKVHQIKHLLKKLNCFLDYTTSTSLGKKYVRADELGIPKCITVDMNTLDDNKVTIRNIDTMEQIRINIDDLNNYFLAKNI